MPMPFDLMPQLRALPEEREPERKLEGGGARARADTPPVDTASEEGAGAGSSSGRFLVQQGGQPVHLTVEDGEGVPDAPGLEGHRGPRRSGRFIVENRSWSPSMSASVLSPDTPSASPPPITVDSSLQNFMDTAYSVWQPMSAVCVLPGARASHE